MNTNIETIQGNLLNAYKQLQPGTMLHCDELVKERLNTPPKELTYEQLLNTPPKELTYEHFWTWTADGALYFTQGKERTPMLAITRRAHNQLLQNLDERLFYSIIQNGMYHCSEEIVQNTLAAPDTQAFDLTELDLELKFPRKAVTRVDLSHNYRLRLDEENRGGEDLRMPKTERRLLERIFGQGKDLRDALEWMAVSAEERQVRIEVLNPEYVEKIVESRGPFWMASSICGAYFSAARTDLHMDYHSARGVLTPVQSGMSTGSSNYPQLKVVTMEDSWHLSDYAGDEGKEDFARSLWELYS